MCMSLLFTAFNLLSLRHLLSNITGLCSIAWFGLTLPELVNDRTCHRSRSLIQNSDVELPLQIYYQSALQNGG